MLYCYEYHKQVDFSVECAAMCLNHESPAWEDDFLSSQGACSLFAYNESLSGGYNCVLCLLLNTGEVYEVNTRDIVAEYKYLNSHTETSKFIYLMFKYPSYASTKIQ